MAKTHEYAARVIWNGNTGTGTSTYVGYGRDYIVIVAGKQEMRGSADPSFRGNAELHNPEDLFVAAISACHMLTYLALCAKNGVSVVAYEDNAAGTLVLTSDGGGSFQHVMLNPVVTIANGEKEAVAVSLHDQAHKLCFIAASCSAPIHHSPTVKVVPPTTIS